MSGNPADGPLTGGSTRVIVDGYDKVPDRSPVVTVALVAAVATAAAAFAEGFRRGAEWLIERYADAESSTGAARELAPGVVVVVVATVVVLAAAIGRRAARRRPGGSGLEALAASARGEPRRISAVATGYRVTAIWSVAAGLVSLGRESAIIEAGGAMGSVTGRRTGGKGDAMALAGIAAAFAAAYHAPLAAIVYVEEHLRVRGSRRAVRFAVAGAIGGHLVTVGLLDSEALFPPVAGSRWALVVAGLAVAVPAAVAARVFLGLRTVAADDGWRQRLPTTMRYGVVAVAAVVAGLAVALAPDAAGNGMDGLRTVPVSATVGLAVALLVGKIVGTTAALAAGAPGGVISPSMAIAGGAALLVVLGAEAAGLAVEHPWDVVVAAMVVGIAVGLRSPIMAPLLVAELLGDYTLIPALAVVALAAAGIDRLLDLAATGVDRLAHRAATEPATRVRDEDG